MLRPLLFTLGFAVLAFGSLCSNVVLIGATVMDKEVSWWMMLAPASAFVVQVASGLIVGFWGIDRLARIIGDYLVQLGVGSGERGLWWRRYVTAARWAGTAMWGIAAAGLTIGSLLGVVLTVPLFAAGGDSTIVALLGHTALMLFGLAAGGVLLTTRVARLRSGDQSSRDWSARIRGRTRDGIGKLWQFCLSVFAWLLGEAVLWTSCAGLLLIGLADRRGGAPVRHGTVLAPPRGGSLALRLGRALGGSGGWCVAPTRSRADAELRCWTRPGARSVGPSQRVIANQAFHRSARVNAPVRGSRTGPRESRVPSLGAA